MKTIVIYTDGTLGDHLPNIALGHALAARGFHVRMAINQAMHPYAQRAGLEAIALTDVERGPAEARQNAWAWNHWRDPATVVPNGFQQVGPDHFLNQTRDLIEICRGADLLIATAIRFLGFTVHHAIGIPWLTVSLNPSSFLQPAAEQAQADFQKERAREYENIAHISQNVLAKLGIEKPMPAWRHGALFARHILLASSPHFSQPNVEQFQPHNNLDLTGFWYYQDPAWQDWQPEPALARFCERKPIVLSFSSQPLEERRATLIKHVQAVARLDRPLLVQRGWADFSETDLPDNVNRNDIMFAEFIPHDWLFAHAFCAIQHGGIGSIARALRQGCPLLIEPYGNDQFYNAERVTELGVGAALSPFRSTVTDIAQVLNDYVLTPGVRGRAQAISAQLRNEDGLTAACEMIERFLNRFDAEGKLPSVYETFTPPLTPRKRTAPVETTQAASTTQDIRAAQSLGGESQTSKPILILFYNLTWNSPQEFERLDLPADCRWTTDHQYFAQADAVIFHIPTLGDISALIKSPGQAWVAWSMECDSHYPLQTDPALMRRFDLTMTYHRDSDIPVPYYGWEMMRAFQSPPHLKQPNALAAAFISSHVNQSRRLEYLGELMRHLPVHSYGNQLQNVKLEHDRGHVDKLAALAKHKFTLAFENAITPDYVTEKFFDPLLVGSVPVYLGAPNIIEFAPGEHCFINASDFDSPQKLAEYLFQLDVDDAAYHAYLAWRSKPLRDNFVRMAEKQREHFLVRLYRQLRQRRDDTVRSTPTVGSRSEPASGNAASEVANIAIPKILHQTWKDENLPERLREFRQTWRRHHPDWELRLWTDADNRDFIRQNYSWFLPIYDSYPENIMRVGAVRYFILPLYGGVYADLDIECLRPLDPLLEDKQILLGLEPPAHIQAPLARGRGLHAIVGNAIMASVPQHPFWDHVAQQLVAFHRAPGPLDATGPFFLTYASQSYAHPEQIHIASHQLFYPISNEKPWGDLSQELQTQIAETAYTIHHWQGSWWQQSVAQPAQPVKLTLLMRGKVISTMVISPDQYRDVLSTRRNLPKISCLMVTKDRVEWAKRSIHCFQRQSYTHRELVIVDDSADDALEQWIKPLNDSRIVYRHLPDENRSLGELRNIAVEQATGNYVAQWDDDDLSDPQRLEIQMAVIFALNTDACFLERHRLLWLNERRMAMSTRRIWEGSFLCAKEKLSAYPALRQGEDTPVIEKIIESARVALLDQPELYTYISHGGNTFNSEHWENHWLTATESFEGPLFVAVLIALESRLRLTLPVESAQHQQTPPASSRKQDALPISPQPVPKTLPTETKPKILILVPVKDAVQFLPLLWKILKILSYPHDRISLAFLESDSIDGTYALIEENLPALRAEFAKVSLFKRDYGYHPDVPRWQVNIQFTHRSILAKSRNHLLACALDDEEWVLWIDADVSHWPDDVIEQLLSYQKDILVPHCIFERNGDTFDRNTFKLKPEAADLDWSPYIINNFLNPPEGFGRLHLSDLRQHECVEVDAVGGTMLFIRADIHREGLVFPTFNYKGYVETEGLAQMAKDMGYKCWGLPRLEIFHP